jgi:hypothetical protein
VRIATALPGRLCTDAPSYSIRLAATNADATSRAYCCCSSPPNGMRYVLPAAAASIACVGAEVSPWSRPTPYTVCGRMPTLETLLSR